MEKTFKPLSASNGMTRRAFLAATVASAGLLIVGTARADVPERLAELRSKFREMEGYGIPPFVTWSDPTMRSLLSALSQANNSSARSGGAEPFPLSGSCPEEQFRSLNSFIGRSPESPFGTDSLIILERRL